MVSVCTPTYNRRPFIKSLISCFNNQDYPKEHVEWIIIDDGTDKIEDLVKDVKQVKYFSYDKKMTLGKKRNLMNEKSSGDIIVYMDDDDYYPPDRISHAVKKLQSSPKALCAGSSEIYCYFKELDKIYKFGPYGPSHATAGTFAFKRQLLNKTKYNENACVAEEKEFLLNYTVPFVQLDSLKTIIVFSHEQNTFDKKTLLNKNNRFITESHKKLSDFIEQPEIIKEYTEIIPEMLKSYTPGKVEMKPDVVNQLKALKEKRASEKEKLKEKFQEKQSELTNITVTQPDGSQKQLTTIEVISILEEQQEKIKELTNKLTLYENNNGTHSNKS